MTPIEKALVTWYPEDHPLHNDPLHPAIGLAGEAGELLDLYKKERFKDGASWWDCVYCEKMESDHFEENSRCEYFTTSKNYTPKILDELGDLWYYLRILAYQQKMDLSELVYRNNQPNSELNTLVSLGEFSIDLLQICINVQKINQSILTTIFFYLQDILFLLDCTLDQLTELNWQKLKDGTNNDWKATLENQAPGLSVK